MTYEYKCRVCSHQFEAEQSIKDAPFEECPKCHVSALYRLVTGGSGFVLQGGGWSSDGYSSSKEQ